MENNFVGVVEGPDGSAILEWPLSGRYILCSTMTSFQLHIQTNYFLIYKTGRNRRRLEGSTINHITLHSHQYLSQLS